MEPVTSTLLTEGLAASPTIIEVAATATSQDDLTGLFSQTIQLFNLLGTGHLSLPVLLAASSLLINVLVGLIRLLDRRDSPLWENLPQPVKHLLPIGLGALGGVITAAMTRDWAAALTIGASGLTSMLSYNGVRAVTKATKVTKKKKG